MQRWRDASPILAYDDPDLRVVFQPGGSDWLLITFGDALAPVDGMRFAADALARKHGFACLGFMARHPHWFPADAIARAIPSIAYTLGSFRRILTYGCSMGAYAAIKHAAALGATDVVALGPQFSIDPAECAFDCGYQEFFTPRMVGMGIRARDLTGRVALLYDAGHALDRHHADAIAALGPAVTRIHVPSADHQLAPMLAGADFTADLMLAWLRHDMRAITTMLAARRRTSPVRIRVLLARAALRHPALALAALELLARTDRLGLVEAEPHLVPLLRTLLARGLDSEAERALAVAGERLPPLHAAILRQDLARAAAAPVFDGPPIRTVHGTKVFYDSVAGTLCHRTEPASAAEAFGLHPASLTRQNRLMVSIGGTAMACARDPHGGLGLVRDARHDAPCVHALILDPPGFALGVGGAYLCASPDGKIAGDRLEVNAWERFTSG